jgi:hypothetical protein
MATLIPNWEELITNLCKANLSKTQKKALVDTISKCENLRPLSSKHISIDNALRKVKVKPHNKRFKKVMEGYNNGEYKPMPNFKPLLDVPIGWSLCNLHDSGYNHSVVNAASAAWITIWNGWDSWIVNGEMRFSDQDDGDDG